MRGTNCDLVIFLLIVIAEITAGYRNFTLDSPEVCSPNTKKRLKLGLYSNSGMIITQKYLSRHSLDWAYDSKCKFEVKTDNSDDHRDGIFVVIQQLEMRRDEQTGDCIDYVQFKRRDGTNSRKFCGRLSASDLMNREDYDETLEPDEFMNENSFNDPRGEIDVYVHVAKQALKPFEHTEILLVFTAYRPCYRGAGSDRPCTEANRNICIFINFFTDGLVNCPYANCLDEEGCTEVEHDMTVKRESIGNKVLIGSVTSLLLTFGLFICCIYICRKYGTLCWSEEFSRPAAGTVVVSPPGNRDNCPPEAAAGVTAEPEAPSAPPEKDLPPSYDSLFPSR